MHVSKDHRGRPFGEAARRALKEACRVCGLNEADATLIRLGENALYRLPSAGVVARVARSMSHWDDAVKEVAVARWLSAEGIHAGSALEIVQPIDTGEHPVTFWHYIDGRPGDHTDIVDLAEALQRLHRLERPSSWDLPNTAILGRVARRVTVAAIPVSDQVFLLDRCRQLNDSLQTLSFPLDRTAVHGDAHVANLMVTGSEALLIDFERFSWGQPEWDLSLTATEYVTGGWLTRTEYQDFVHAYGGFDVMEWEGFAILRAVQELKMTTWIMQNINESQEIADEYAMRLRALKTGRAERPWRPF
jgi:Ser/Thr protein kinase RdoA (MazF antagonist)